MLSLPLQLSACFLALSSLSAALVPRSHVVHESRHNNDDGLFQRTRVEGDVEVPVRIGLTQKNLEFGGNELYEISDPSSTRYGRHYTAEEVEELFAPSHEAVAAVREWVEEKIDGARISVSANRQWLQFDAAISELEGILHTEFYHYNGQKHEDPGVGCEKYHVPSSIRDYVDYVTPGVKAFRPGTGPAVHKRSGSAPGTARVNRPGRPRLRPDPDQGFKKTQPCYKRLTPDCIKKQYGINDTPPTGTNTSVGVFEESNELYSQKSLHIFLEKYTQIPPDSVPKYIRVDGAIPVHSKHGIDYGEADLDLQVLYPLAFHSAQIVDYNVDDRVYGNDLDISGFNTFLDAIDGSYCNYTAFGITGDSPKYDGKYPDPSTKKGAYKGQLQCGKYKPTDVISVSWLESEDYLPVNYQRRQCNEFMKLGLQGVSVMYASGDYGVRAQFDDNGNYCLGEHNRKFGVNSPQNCPFVTTLGSTVLLQDGTEVATKSFASGGGFSNVFPRPKYQDAAVSTYLTKHKPKYKSYKVKYNKQPDEKVGLYNSMGRGYPDVSALGDNIANIYDQKPYLAGGTSASSPLFAGIITRINAHRLKAGKKTLGFLNPMLYVHPEMFNDIVSGNNPGCGSQGFNATKGWDPVTGLGTPKYGKMKEILTNLP